MSRYTRRVVALAAVAVLVFASVAAAQTGPVRVGGVVPQPKKLKHVEPVYPEEARAAGTEGSVILDLQIGTDGSVVGAKVLRTGSVFEKAAVEAVRQWKYAPSELNGQPVEVLLVATIPFKLSAAGQPQPMEPPQPMRVGGDIKEPRQIKRVEPVYPPEAIANKAEGSVIIEAVIGTDGSVVNAKALRATPGFEGVALDAVRQWQYTPTLLNGAPIEVLLVVTINFQLRQP